MLAALRLRRRLLVRYRSLSSDRTTERRIHPYHVFNHRGDWYLAACDEARKDVRIFALHRIRRATLTTESYELPPDFSFREVHGRRLRRAEGRQARSACPSASRPARPAGSASAAGTARRGSRKRSTAASSSACTIAETSEIVALGAAVRQRGRSARTALAELRKLDAGMATRLRRRLRSLKAKQAAAAPRAEGVPSRKGGRTGYATTAPREPERDT